MGNTRDAVIDATSRIIERRRPSLPVVAEIAREAGVSRPTFYAYFPTGDAAFEAVVTRVRDEVLELQELADVSSVAATLESTLIAMLDITVAHLGLLTLLAAEAHADPRISALWHDIHDRPLRRHARYIERLDAGGMAQPMAAASVIAECVNGMTTRFAHLIVENPGRRDELAVALVAGHNRLVGLAEPSR